MCFDTQQQVQLGVDLLMAHSVTMMLGLARDGESVGNF